MNRVTTAWTCICNFVMKATKEEEGSCNFEGTCNFVMKATNEGFRVIRILHSE
jgi:hypothetical protein